MASYVASFKGYIADVPEVWFKRCDGKVFHYDEVSQASVNPQTNFTEINGGWSMYPVSYLPGQSTMEITMTSAQFDADMFAMANLTTFEADSTYKTYVTERHEIASNKIDLLKVAVAGSVQINGLTEDTTAAAGKFSTDDVAATDTVPAHTQITFFAGSGTPGDPGYVAPESGLIEVTYETVISDAQVIDVTNSVTATGSVVCKWPVYPSSDDCSETSIKGYVVLKIYNARVTAMPGFDTSYKSAATNQVTWSAIDAKRPDGATWNMAYMGV